MVATGGKRWQIAWPPCRADYRSRLRRRRGAHLVAAIALRAYGAPEALAPWAVAHYIAYEGRRPVGAAAVYHGGDKVWLGFGATCRTTVAAAFTRR